MYLRGFSVLAPDALLFNDVAEGVVFMSWLPEPGTASFSRSFAGPAKLVASIAVPGVFGVFAEEPKDANAPDPKPKAEEAPAVGEATLEVVKGVMPLREVLPDVLSTPDRLVAEKVREASGLPFSLVVEEVARGVLLELIRVMSISRSSKSVEAELDDQL